MRYRQQFPYLPQQFLLHLVRRLVLTVLVVELLAFENFEIDPFVGFILRESLEFFGGGDDFFSLLGEEVGEISG